MSDATDPIRTHLETALCDSESYFGRGQIFMGLVGLFCVVVSLIREIYFLLLISVALFGGLVAMMTYAQHRTRRNLASGAPRRSE